MPGLELLFHEHLAGLSQEETVMAAHPEDANKVFVFVGCFQGLVDEVAVYRSETQAERAFKRYTGVSYKAFARAVNQEDDPASVLGQNLEDCRIFETVLR